MTIKYVPFHNRKHLIKRALESAILWEESRIDAGVCDMDKSGEELENTNGQIKAYRKYYRELSGGLKTTKERLDEKLAACKSIPLNKLVKSRRFKGRIKSS